MSRLPILSSAALLLVLTPGLVFAQPRDDNSLTDDLREELEE